MRKNIMEAQGPIEQKYNVYEIQENGRDPAFYYWSHHNGKNDDPLKVIPTILRVISEQDNKKGGEEDSTDEGCRNCVTLCIGIYLKEIDMPMSAVASEKPQVKKWAEELHAIYINPVEVDPYKNILPNNATSKTLINVCSSVKGLKQFLETSASAAREEKSKKQGGLTKCT